MDIEGCFPNMPKETIRFAIRDIFKQLQKQGKKGVSVPRRSTAKPCIWKQRDDASYVWLTFATILDVLDFSLDQAVFLRIDGKFLRQKKGIPMGDALSPGMTIGTCGWMEREWMCSLDDATKAMFAAARYMDDILLIYDDRMTWQKTRFLTDFGASECYQPPLKLEKGTDGVFLETELHVGTCGIRYKLKNVNANGERKVWRYHHFSSYTPYSQKRATLVATLKKKWTLWLAIPTCVWKAPMPSLPSFHNLATQLAC